MEKKLALLDFLQIDYFLHDDNYYYYGEEFYSEECEEVEEYKEYNNSDNEECNHYSVLTDDEAEERFDNYVDSYIKENILSKIPNDLHSYFKWKEYKNTFDRGAYLAHYDGYENYKNGYYIYKIS